MAGAAASRAEMKGSLKLDTTGDGVVGAIVLVSEIPVQSSDAAVIEREW